MKNIFRLFHGTEKSGKILSRVGIENRNYVKIEEYEMWSDDRRIAKRLIWRIRNVRKQKHKK